MLNKLNPTGTAGGEHRESFLACDSLNKLVCLFKNCEVGGEVHIEHLVNAESADCRNHFALNVCADRHTEALAESCLD